MSQRLNYGSICLGSHIDRQKGEGSEMCVTFKSFPSHLAALEPQRVPLFAWHRGAQGHMVTYWLGLAKGGKEREVNWERRVQRVEGDGLKSGRKGRENKGEDRENEYVKELETNEDKDTFSPPILPHPLPYLPLIHSWSGDMWYPFSY